MKYASLDLGTVEAVFNKLGGIEGARAFLRGDTTLAPGSFKRNEHGHIVLTVTGLNLTGEQEIERAGLRVSDPAQSCLTSTRRGSYNERHRLVDGQQYKIVLMPTKEIEHDFNRTTDALRKWGIEKYGYEELLAGIVLRICESVSNEQMREMGFWYIAVPHDPIEDSDGDPRILFAHRFADVPELATGKAHSSCWSDGGAFAFLDPDSGAQQG